MLKNAFVAITAGAALFGTFHMGLHEAKPETITKTVTRTKTVEVTSRACIRAVRMGDEWADLALRGYSLANQSLTEIADSDYDSLSATTDEITSLTDEIDAFDGDAFTAAKDACTGDADTNS